MYILSICILYTQLIADLDETIQATELFLDDECQFKLISIVNADDNLYRI